MTGRNTKLKIFLMFVLILSVCWEIQVIAANPESQRIVQTYGEAELTAQPDLAKISVAIETRSLSAEDAVTENARLANTVLASLLTFGLSEDHLQTSSYRLNSYRNWQKEPSDIEDEQIYYQATNEIIISTTQLETIGELIDIAVKAGANYINYINFELEEPQDLMIQVLAMATQQAFRKANAIAESIHEHIDKLSSIREERTDYAPFRLQQSTMQREMAFSAEPTPVTPGEVTIRAMVIAEFSLLSD